MSLYTRLLERTVYATTLGTHEIDTGGPRRRKKMTETMKRLEVDSRNGKITKRITATRPRDEIKKRTRDGVIWKNWTFAVVEGHEIFFFFSVKSSLPAFLENLFPSLLSPLKPWPLCAALRWILHESLALSPSLPPTHLSHSLHHSPRASPGQPTSVAFPPSSKYVGGSECTRLDNNR